ncbi:MAG: YdcF family protein [Bacteroidales bacterium]
MFEVMKVVEMLAAPLNMVLLALLAAMALSAWGRRQAAWRLVRIATVVLVLLAVPPWETWLIAPLEDRVPPPADLPKRVDGVIVLGGAIQPEITEARGQPALNGQAERITALVRLARDYPEARLVYTAGSASIVRQDLKEAPAARPLLQSMGVDVGRVLFEDLSRNTRENAVFTYQLVRPAPDQTWLLVTSAAHMPRSLGAFRAAGWQVVPYPVDYTVAGTASWGGGVGAGARAVGQGLHEWAGLFYYRLRGWSDSWYPGL